MTTLDHRPLRQFLAIADAGTVRAAARELNISQPPLTAAIRQLEARLGVALFERSVKGMTLTPAGETLASEARAILARLTRAEADVRTVAGRPVPLRVGFVSAALNRTLPTLIRALAADAQPSPQLSEMTTPEQLEALAADRIDVGLLHPPVPKLPDLRSMPLGRDPFWAALPVGHKLAARRRLRFADIAHEPFVLFPRSQGPVLYDAIRALVAECGAPFRVAVEARRIHSQLAMVAAGLGVGLITRSTAGVLTFDGVRAIPLTDVQDRLFLELCLMAAPARLPVLAKALAGSGRP